MSKLTPQKMYDEDKLSEEGFYLATVGLIQILKAGHGSSGCTKVWLDRDLNNKVRHTFVKPEKGENAGVCIPSITLTNDCKTIRKEKKEDVQNFICELGLKETEASYIVNQWEE